MRHGEEATAAIHRGIEFYKKLFQEKAGLSWDEVCREAKKFRPMLFRNWPQYFEEIDGT